jgi:predicted  nucleic acid-binding Zn-ribbon protein
VHPVKPEINHIPGTVPLMHAIRDGATLRGTMTQNVLQALSDADQPAEAGTVAASVQDARALLDHLQSTLAGEAEGVSSADSLPPVIHAVSEGPSFGEAVARQADQIQYLIEQVTRLESDAQSAGLQDLRDLHGALNDLVLRTKQDASDVAARIDLLTQAVAGRIGVLDGLMQDADAAIVTLEENVSSSQHTVRDLSADLAKLGAHAESGRNEIAGLHQRIESAEQSLGQRLARVDATIESGRNEIAGLHQRIESAEQSLGQRLARAGETIESGRNEIAQLNERLESTDQSLAQGLARVDESIEAGRHDIARLHQRIASTDRAFTQGLTTLGERAVSLRDGLGQVHARLELVENSTALQAGIHKKIEVLGCRLEEMDRNSSAEIGAWRLQDSHRFAALMDRLNALEQTNRALSEEKEQTSERLQAAEQTIAIMTQRQKALSAWHDRIAHVLLANPESQVD